MKNLAFDWNDLKFFLAVARHGGLSGAAEVLGTSPSTVSRHVDALEKRIGATLFLRQQTGYLLTDDGSELLEHVERMEQAMMTAERRGPPSARQEVSGRVRLATTEILASYLIAPHLRRFRERYPKLQVDIHASLARLDLAQREADLALRLIDPNRDDGANDYVATRVGRLAWGAYCAKSLMPRGAPEQSAWTSFDYVSWGADWADLPNEQWIRAVFRGKQPGFVCNNLQAHYAAIRNGFGIGLLPRFIGDRDDGVIRLDGDYPVPARDLWLVYHRDLKTSRRVIAMRDFVIELVHTWLDQ